MHSDILKNTLVKKLTTILLALFLFLFAEYTFAQRAEGSANSNAPKRQTLDFEDEIVTGASEKPELFYLFQKKNFNYRKLIRLRENFLPEMRRTSEDVQRARGAD